jgi:hypothetical protein
MEDDIPESIAHLLRDFAAVQHQYDGIFASASDEEANRRSVPADDDNDEWDVDQDATPDPRDGTRRIWSAAELRDWTEYFDSKFILRGSWQADCPRMDESSLRTLADLMFAANINHEAFRAAYGSLYR